MTDSGGLGGYSVEPHLFVVFGGTGDLMRRKLLPVLRRLSSLGVLGTKRALLAIGRQGDLGDEGFREWARQALRDAGAPEEDISGLEDARVFYQGLPDGDAGDYARLAARIEEVEAHCDLPGNRAF